MRSSISYVFLFPHHYLFVTFGIEFKSGMLASIVQYIIDYWAAGWQKENR